MPTIRSTIDSTVEYKETKKIEDEDKEQDYNIYEIEIMGINVLTTIGQPKKIKNIIYFPLYLIKYNRKVLQIGLYEIEKKIISYNTIDESNLLNYINLSTLILYSFVNPRYIQQLYLSPEKYQTQQEESAIQNEEQQMIYDSSKIKNKIFQLQPNTASILLLKPETEQESRTIHNNYNSEKIGNNFWVTKFMKNNFYSLTQIPGDGNCFFNSIIESFKTIGHITTVEQLKQILTDNLDENVFNTYYSLYSSYKHEIKNLEDEKNIYIEKYNSLSKQKATSSETLLKEITKQIKQIKKDVDNIKVQIDNAKKNLQDVAFMKYVRDIDELKQKIKNTTEYYADDWAVSLMEYVLNIKTIILSKDSYREKDIYNVLRISETHPKIQDANIFNPDYYIILEFGNTHYQLIKYKGKGIFKFSEIPYDLKILISDKCLQRRCGAFNYITDFTDFTNERNQGQHGGGNNIDDNDNQILDELYQYGNVKLWDDEVKLLFYDMATDILPGKLMGEQIPDNQFKNYVELSKIKNWRKKLDNSWIQPFTLDGKTWASVEHYYQASKFKHHPEIYNKFSIDDKSELSNNPDKARKFARKYAELIDDTFNPKLELYTAQDAKFLQHDDLSYLLICTNNANLFQQRKRKPPMQATNLMVIRKRILEQNI